MSAKPAQIGALCLLLSCGPVVLVPLVPPAPAASAHDPQMRLACRGLPEPVRVRGTQAAYTDLDRALRVSVERAVRPFVERNRARRPGGWDLLVSIVQADARRSGDRVALTMTVGATLRTQEGQILLGQTQAYCAESAAATADAAAPVFFSCLDGVGRDLSSWLGGVEP